MNRFWELILKVRDFSHHLSVKQYGEEGSTSEYKFKFMVFLSGYGLTLIFIVLQTLFYFFGTKILPVGKADPWPVKLLLAGSLIFLPIYLLRRYLLKKIEYIPLPTTYNHKEYRKYIVLYWVGFLSGYFLWLTVGIFLMSYLRGLI